MGFHPPPPLSYYARALSAAAGRWGGAWVIAPSSPPVRPSLILLVILPAAGPNPEYHTPNLVPRFFYTAKKKTRHHPPALTHPRAATPAWSLYARALGRPAVVSVALAALLSGKRAVAHAGPQKPVAQALLHYKVGS